MRSWPLLLALALAGAPVAAGCGTDATGVGTCKEIEEARCTAAASCPEIQITPPYYTNGSAVDACIRYYDTACLHGLAVGNQSDTVVNGCVAAIKAKGACAVVENPATSAACSWLTPPNTPPPEAGPGEAGDAGDAGTDVGDAAVQFPDGF